MSVVSSVDLGDTRVYVAAFSADDTLLVLGTRCGKAQLVAVDGAAVRASTEHDGGIEGAAWRRGSADGSSLLATGGWDDMTVNVHQVMDEGRVVEERGALHADMPVLAVRWSPDGRRLAVGSMDDVIIAAVSQEGKPGKTVSLRFDEGAWDVAWSPDGTMVAAAGDAGSVEVWHVADKRRVRSLRAGPRAWEVAFSPAGDLLAAVSKDGHVRLWDTTTWKMVKQWRRSGDVYSVAFSPDGRHLLTGGRDGVASISSVATGKRVFELVGHEKDVYSATWSNSGTLVATASFDGTGRIWDVADIVRE